MQTKLEAKKPAAQDQGFEVDELNIYREIVRKASHDEKKKGSKALFFLQQALVDQMFLRIMGAISAKEAWDILNEEFHGSKKVRAVKLQTLRRELENIKMKDSESAKNYYAKIKELVNQMKVYGETISDKKVIEKILVSVT
ncbi:hypothetical protein QYF36_002686 [Acer negundo]|nr:hypothetical protein QYF36_002686 [Acer negundo]